MKDKISKSKTRVSSKKVFNNPQFQTRWIWLKAVCFHYLLKLLAKASDLFLIQLILYFKNKCKFRSHKGRIPPYLVEVCVSLDDINATFAICVPRDHYSCKSRSYDQADWIHVPCKTGSKDWSSKKKRRNSCTKKAGALLRCTSLKNYVVPRHRAINLIAQKVLLFLYFRLSPFPTLKQASCKLIHELQLFNFFHCT